VGDIGLEFHISKVPMKFNSFPLTLVLDLHFHTAIKLNLDRGGARLLDESEIHLPEWHHMRFEGLISSKYTNRVADILKVRNMFTKQAKILTIGKEMPEVEEWTITNLDHRIEYVDN